MTVSSGCTTCSVLFRGFLYSKQPYLGIVLVHKGYNRILLWSVHWFKNGVDYKGGKLRVLDSCFLFVSAFFTTACARLVVVLG